MKVTLLIPTFNEVQGVSEILPRIKQEWCDQLLIVDGGSTDGTVDYLKAHGYSVIMQQRKGLRYAYLAALPSISSDVIVTFSPDGNSIPELIPALTSKLSEGYDMVIVSRYAEGAKSYDDDAISGLANLVFTRTINFLFGARYTDAMGIFRAYKRDLISMLDLDKDSSYWPAESIFIATMSWEMLLSIRCAKRALKVAEIPGDEPCRIGGRRRLHFVWGLEYVLQLFKEIFSWR